MPPPTLAFREASKRFAGRVALGPLEFGIDGPGVVGLVGPNGAGKTTTLRLAAGYFAPSSGTVEVAGRADPHDDPDRRAGIGYLPERPPLYAELTVEEQLLLAGRLKRLEGSRLKERVEHAATRCGLRAVLKQRTGGLSAGYRQRTGLAAALLVDAPLLLLDEPTSHLDPLQRQETLAVIAEEGRSRTIVLSTHSLSEIATSCGRILVISGGRLVADGSPGALAAAGSSCVRLRVRAPAAELLAALANAGALESRLLGEAGGVTAVEITRGLDANGTARVALDSGWELIELTSASGGIEALLRDGAPEVSSSS